MTMTWNEYYQYKKSHVDMGECYWDQGRDQVRKSLKQQKMRRGKWIKSLISLVRNIPSYTNYITLNENRDA